MSDCCSSNCKWFILSNCKLIAWKKFSPKFEITTEKIIYLFKCFTDKRYIVDFVRWFFLLSTYKWAFQGKNVLRKPWNFIQKNTLKVVKYPGADPGFFLGGVTLVSCSTLYFRILLLLQNISCIRKPQVVPGGGGGVGPPSPSPWIRPWYLIACEECVVFQRDLPTDAISAIVTSYSFKRLPHLGITNIIQI